MNRLDSRELYEWAAFEQVMGPIGKDREDYYNARLCHAIAMSVYGGKGRRPELKDYMPPWVNIHNPVTDNQDTALRMQADQIFGAIARNFERKEKVTNGNNHATPYKARV